MRKLKPKNMKNIAIILFSAWIGLTGAVTVRAQSVREIYSFTNGPANPEASLTLGPDGYLYGTTRQGGIGSAGTVFKMTTNGTLTTLVNFCITNGAYPYAGLTLGPDGNFYGTTYQGGTTNLNLGLGDGTVFRVTTNGTLTTLVNFNYANGDGPRAGLTLGPDGDFYGTTQYGGDGGPGTVFKVTTNGTLTTLANFYMTNGANPLAGLTLGPDGNLYGTTGGGGATNLNGGFGYGTVFKVTTNGALTTLVNLTNGNGDYPTAGLALGPDGNFYGTTWRGGSAGLGTVFQVATNGNLTTLVNFDDANGANPYAGLALGPDGNLYGTTWQGGSAGLGTVFQVTTNGTLTTLVNFDDANGFGPDASMTLGPDGNFYGTTEYGGSSDDGTVFQLTTNGMLTTLVNFISPTGNDPQAGLTLGPDGSLFGTTEYGGSSGDGTVFKLTTDGTLTTLVIFNSTNGANPQASLTQGPDGNFFGTTEYGGSHDAADGGDGTVFEVTSNGTLTTLFNCNSTNGYSPEAGLTLGPDGNFYGTTAYGGSSIAVFPSGVNYGTIFELTTNGTWTTLVNFNVTNGSYPLAGLTLGPDGDFYGTASSGGSSGVYGTMFKMTTNGTLTTLVNFYYTNGGYPQASLTLGSDGNFYGTTSGGGSSGDPPGYGTVFRVTTNGALTTLINFSSDNGQSPYAGLALGPDGNFYGTTWQGGNSGLGTVFKLTPGGTLTTLLSFNGANGGSPSAGLTLGPDGNFYGTTSYGGSGGGGNIFQLDLPPDFIISPTNQSVAIGGATTLSCQPFGTGPFAYQWLSNGIPITGATGSSLTIANISLQTTNVQFQVLVSNAWGSITSSVASLTVLQPPDIYAIFGSSQGNYTVYLASHPNSTNRLWTTTNLTAPQSQWQVISTNITASNGLSQFSDTNTVGMPNKFYRLSYP